MIKILKVLEINKMTNGGNFYLFLITLISLCITIVEAVGIGSLYPLYKLHTAGVLGIVAKDMNPIEFSAIILLVIFFIKAVSGVYLNWLQSKYIFGSIQRLGKVLLEKELQSPLKKFIKDGPSRLNQATINDVDLFCNTTLVAQINLLSDILYLLGLIVLIFYVDPLVALGMTLITLTSYMVVSAKKLLKSEELGEKRRRYEQKRLTIIKDVYFNILSIRLSKHGDQWIELYDEINKKLSEVLSRQYFGVTYNRYVLEFIGVAGIVALIIYYANSRSMEIEQILINIGVVGFVAMRLAPVVSRVNQSIKSLDYSKKIIDKIHESLIKNYKYTYSMNDGKISDIEFKEVSIKFDNRKIFDNLNFKLKSGQSLLIKGRSGSGKTTVLKLILGIESPSTGNVIVNNKEVDSSLIDIYKDKIAYVDQNVEIIEGTIAENISMNRYGMEERKIKELVKRLKMDFVDELEDGIKTQIGKNTILSGGQKQKISIARAFYDKEIDLIILDEATSALDEQSTNEIRDFIAAYENAILIEITHKNTIKKSYAIEINL